MSLNNAAQSAPHKRNRIVAFVDILGASQATMDGKIDALVGDIFRLGRTMNWRHVIHLQDKDGKVQKTLEFRPGVAQFSDCLLLWSDPLDGLPPEDFVRTAGSFLWNLCTELGRLLVGGVPFRAGVSEGPVFIHPELNIYAGRPIVEAAKLEGSQNWLGAAMLFSENTDRLIHRPDQIFGCGDRSMFEHYVVHETVPLKHGSFDQKATDQVCALNWALGMQEVAGLRYAELRQKLLALQSQAGTKAHDKYELALAFLGRVEQQYPKEIGLLQAPGSEMSQ